LVGWPRTEQLQIWEVMSPPAGHAALQYAAKCGNPAIEPLVNLIEEWWGPWLCSDREANLRCVHSIVARLMAIDGWQEAGFRPVRGGS
jgi:hypothetical protein